MVAIARQPTQQVIHARVPIYVIGFPKSGLHLATTMVKAFANPATEKVPHWFGNAGGNAWTAETIDYLTEKAPRVFDLLARAPGRYLKGHLAHSDELAALLESKRIAVLFVYRDLRDVLVSQAYHVLSDEKSVDDPDKDRMYHPDKDRYRALGSFEEVLKACLVGLDEFAGLHDRWAMYAPWLDCPWLCSVRFEDMVHKPHNVANEFVRYTAHVVARRYGERLALPASTLVNQSNLAVRFMQDPVLREGSPTIRSGKTGAWRKHFTPEIKTLFKARDDGWLVRLGYARNEDW